MYPLRKLIKVTSCIRLELEKGYKASMFGSWHNVLNHSDFDF